MGHECTSPRLSDASRSECGGPGSPASATVSRERGAPAPHCAPMPGVPYGTSAIGQSPSARSAAPSAHAQVWAQCTRQRACPVPMRQTTAGMPFPIERLLSMRSRGSALPGRMRSFIRFSALGNVSVATAFFALSSDPAQPIRVPTLERDSLSEWMALVFRELCGGREKTGFFCIFPCRGLPI